MSSIQSSFQSEQNHQTFNLSSSINQPSAQSTSTLVSCVFCIDASVRQRINWKSFGIEYINAFIRKLAILYPGARMRFMPVLFNSLPPTTPASISVYQPLPFSDLSTFINALPTLLPGFLPEPTLSDQSPEIDPSADYQLYGGSEPAILEAIIRAMEVMDQKFSPTSTRSAPPHRRQHHVDPTLPHRRHIVVLTATDLGPPTLQPAFSGSAHSVPDPLIEELPRIVPLFNRKAEYDNVTLLDLAGRYRKDAQGRYNLNDKKPGLLEQKNIILGLIAICRVPKLASFLTRLQGQNPSPNSKELLRSLHPTHYTCLPGFNGVPASPNKHAVLSDLIPRLQVEPKPNPKTSADQPIAVNQASGTQKPSPSSPHSQKRSRTDSDDDDQPLAQIAPLHNPNTNLPTRTAAQSVQSMNTLPPRSVNVNNNLPGSNFDLSSFLPNPTSSNQRNNTTSPFPPQGVSQNMPQQSNVHSNFQNSLPQGVDQNLAQGLSLLLGGGPASNNLSHQPTPPVSNPPIDPSTSFQRPTQPTIIDLTQTSSQSSALGSSSPALPQPAPPTDDLSRALALLGGSGKEVGLPLSRPTSSLPQSRPTYNPPSTQPVTNSMPTQQQIQLQQQQLAQKQQQLIQQQLKKHQQQQQEMNFLSSQSQANTNNNNNNNENNSDSNRRDIPPRGTLPTSTSTPTRHISPAHRMLMEAAQAHAKAELSSIDLKRRSGEITEAEAKAQGVRVKQVITDQLRSIAMKAQQAQQAQQQLHTQNFSGPSTSTSTSGGMVNPMLGPALNPNGPNVGPAHPSEGPMIWQGTLNWTVGTKPNGQEETVSIRLGGHASPAQNANELRIVAESWPKVWRMMGSLRSTNLHELSAHTTINKPHGLSLHLISNGGGKRDEDLYVKICESMINNTFGVVIFDEIGHGVVLLYNRTMRTLFGLVFQRMPIPSSLRISTPHTLNQTPTSNPSQSQTPIQNQTPTQNQTPISNVSTIGTGTGIRAINPQAQELLQSLSASLNSHHLFNHQLKVSNPVVSLGTNNLPGNHHNVNNHQHNNGNNNHGNNPNNNVNSGIHPDLVDGGGMYLGMNR